MAINSLHIVPYPASSASEQDPLLSTVEHKLLTLIPQEIKEQILNGNGAGLLAALPIIGSITVASTALWVSFLSHWEYTSGIGRYIDDVLGRWLVPGKSLSMIGGIRLSFSFATLPNHRFFFGATLFEIGSADDMEITKRNIKGIFEEIRLNVMAVYKARYISSLKSISLHQKNQMVQDNLNKILDITQTESDQTLFDQMQAFLMKLGREEKVGQIQKTIAQMTESRPKIFDRGMFLEMTHFTVLFKDQFASKRNARHISRVIALHYLFKKMLLEAVKNLPTERHISIKVFKTSVTQDVDPKKNNSYKVTQPVLGILLGLNILRESERLDKRFLLDSIESCIPNVEAVKDAYLFDRRDKKVNLFYIEVHKPDFIPFTIDEINNLKTKLTHEITKQVGSDVHPIFLPRNEEEVARNLIILSQQLKYMRDLPQVSIHYEKQTESELTFSIIMARLLLPATRGLREQILRGQSDIKFSIDEIREIGKLKRKVPKETAVLRVSLAKAPFFRPDYSIDLLRARQRIAYELGRIIGEYRDFNGGMILKQEEALLALRKHIGPISHEKEFLLEDYFYSIRPGIMQTVLPSDVIKDHFYMLQELQKSDEQILSKRVDRFFICFVKDSSVDFRDRMEIAIEDLKIPSYELTSCFLNPTPKMGVMGYILRCEQDDELPQVLMNAIEHALQQELITT
jgi:hypothetical protein